MSKEKGVSNHMVSDSTLAHRIETKPGDLIETVKLVGVKHVNKMNVV
jgi:hypothetical protein